MNWINFLHLYQPANSPEYRIREATEKSYLRIIRALEENEDARFTLNVSGCLVARWREMGCDELVQRIGSLVAAGKVELVGSAAYHPLLPLVPIEEARKQIGENEKILKDNFGENPKYRGFYLPEMAYSPEVGRLIKEMGYEWIILDEISADGGERIDSGVKYIDKDSGLNIVFRSRKISRMFVPDYLQANAHKLAKDSCLVTATDGELYGLRHIDHTAEFESSLKNDNIVCLTVSDYLARLDEEKEISLRNSTWESEEGELRKGEPYKLWSKKGNRIHAELWGLARFALRIVEENRGDAGYDWARWHLVRGLASCAFWWASGHEFKIFSMKAWSPDEIEAGLNDLVRSVRSLDGASKDAKLEAERYNIKIRKLIWEKHWKKYE